MIGADRPFTNRNRHAMLRQGCWSGLYPRKGSKHRVPRNPKAAVPAGPGYKLNPSGPNCSLEAVGAPVSVLSGSANRGFAYCGPGELRDTIARHESVGWYVRT